MSAKPVLRRGKWQIRWFDAAGKRRSRTFERKKDAEQALAQELVKAQRIQQGLEKPELPERTFRELCQLWIEQRVPQKRSGHNDISIINAHFLPRWQDLLLKGLTAEPFAGYAAEQTTLAPKTIANHITLLISIFNHGKDVGWIEAVPRIKKPKVSAKDEFRYLKTLGEVEHFLATAMHVGGSGLHCFYATAVYTGLRAGELAGLRWGDVDLDGRRIAVQRSFAGPTKGGRVRYVPILDVLLPVLKQRERGERDQFVFSEIEGEMLKPHSHYFRDTFEQVLARCDFPRRVNTKRKGGFDKYIRFHDLRHTFASHWVMNGGDMYRLQHVLGHVSISTTMQYAHLSPNVFDEDYGRLGPAVACAG